ncbi:MAG: hypothetical protein KDK34_02185 [Leptospiraceae bacterium]|nr:hypothetical protein [Leptospiraceae bacterium]
MIVELIYDDDCPNAAGARALIERAMQAAGIAKPVWQEHCRQDEFAPSYAKEYGSPTILVNGKDVAPVAGAGGNACRIYRDEAGRMSGLPPEANVIAALGGQSRGESVVTLFASGFAGLFGMLPVVTCAACWPAYAAVLSSLGIGFVNYTPYLMPLMIALTAVALFGLFHRAKFRWGYGPFALGVVAGAFILVSRFVLELDALLYAGAAGFLSASIWNAWPLRRGKDGPGCCL